MHLGVSFYKNFELDQKNRAHRCLWIYKLISRKNLVSNRVVERRYFEIKLRLALRNLTKRYIRPKFESCSFELKLNTQSLQI